MVNDSVSRFLGGPPLAVFAKLVLICILVGFVLTQLHIDLWNLIDKIQDLLEWLWDNVWWVVGRLWRYFLLGAVLVFPIWLVMRLARAPRERPPAP